MVGYIQAYLIGFVLSGVFSIISIRRNIDIYEEYEFTQGEINFLVIFSAILSWLDIVSMLFNLFSTKKKSKREIIYELRTHLDNFHNTIGKK